MNQDPGQWHGDGGHERCDHKVGPIQALSLVHSLQGRHANVSKVLRRHTKAKRSRERRDVRRLTESDEHLV